MKRKDDWVRTRELQRRLSKTKAELAPILERLEIQRLILWDEKKRAIRIRSYDPRDKRRFRWLMDAGRSISQFEPILEKNRTYLVKDFRADVIEEWVRTGAAEWVL